MLCSLCAALDLTAEDFFTGRLDRGNFYDEYHDLGAVEEIRTRAATCPLCRTVLQVLQLEQPCEEPNVEAAQCTLYWQDDGFTTEGDETYGPHVRFLRVRVPGWSIDGHEFHRICLLSDDAPEDAASLFLGRRVPKTISIRRVKRWISACDHGHDCVSYGQFGQLPTERFRLIDTWNGCIVDSNPHESHKYLALSYVWGKNAPGLKLLESNRRLLIRPRGLMQVWLQIPKTIRDAISLTSSLGYQYLWVDSLCITQDDRYDKAMNIERMRSIYSCAVLTIVAATGHDSSTGLPGVRRTDRPKPQHCAAISPSVRLMAPIHLTDGLDRSVYDTRGWTYQEKILSLRRLYFLEGQVIFQCRQRVFREDIALEAPVVSSCFDSSGYRFLSGLDNADPVDMYSGCLWEYSARDLSFEDDRVSAFLGVLELVQSLLDTSAGSHATRPVGFGAGLPLAFFDWALLWDPATPIARSESACWPSWSWTGWQGRVAALVNNVQSPEALTWHIDRSWIQWYCCIGPSSTEYPHRDQASCTPLRTAHEHSPRAIGETTVAASVGAHLPRRRPKLSIEEGEISDPDMLAALQVSNRILVFTTLSLVSSLRPTNVVRGPWRGYHICKRNGTPHGKLWMDKDWACPTEEASVFEFIALSLAKSSVISNEIELPAPEPHAATREGEESEWDAFHVLMLHYPRHPKVAERLAVGVVLQHALFDQGARWREIWLG